jgi:hypothetical protein
VSISASEREDIMARNIAGTRVSVRLVHAFQYRDGKICRENGNEIGRRADDTARVQDDIPDGAHRETFG